MDVHHCAITLEVRLPTPFDSPDMWAKCDMLATVSLARLDRFRVRRGAGARKYVTGNLSADQLKAVRAAILCGLGLGSLTLHL